MAMELKPCPFCGSEAKFIERNAESYTRSKYDVGCGHQGCYMEFGADWWIDTKEEAAELWNRRCAKSQGGGMVTVTTLELDSSTLYSIKLVT